MTDNSNFEKAETLLDINSFIDYFIMELGLNNKAWPQHNIRFWKSDTEGGKWRYIMYDMDIAMYRWPWTKYNQDLLGLKMVEYLDTNKHVNILKSLMDNKSFRQQYSNRHQDLFNTLLGEIQFAKELDKMVNILDPEMPRQFETYPGTYYDWINYYIDRMHIYIQERPYYARLFMDEYFQLGGEAGITITSSHPDDTNISLNSLDEITLPFQGYYFQDIPIELSATSNNSDLVFDHWKIEGGGITSYSYRNQDEFSVNDGDKIKAIFVTKKENSLIQKVIIHGNDLLYTVDLINDAKATVNIYSSNGSKVYQQKNSTLSPGQNVLYLPELAAGYYIFNIANDNFDQSYPITIVQ